MVSASSPTRAAQPLPEHRRSDGDDEQPRGERQPGVELVGDDELREQERDQSEGEDAGGVRRGHGRAEQERVPRLALGSDEVAGDERLPVPRREGVDCAPEGGDQEREQDHAEREVAALDQRLEAPVSVLGRRRDPDRGGRRRRAPGRVLDGRASHVERRAEQALRVGTELVRAARRERGALVDTRAAAGGDDDLAPADPVPVGVIGKGQLPAGRRGAEDCVEAHRLEAAGTRPLRGAMGEDGQRHPLAVDAEIEAAREDRAA